MADSADCLLVMTTCDDAAVAERIAHRLVERHLAACVNVLPAARSVYRWQGRVESADEYTLLIKTQASRFEALQAALVEAHPYELPEVLAVPIVTGSEEYLQWLVTSTQLP